MRRRRWHLLLPLAAVCDVTGLPINPGSSIEVYQSRCFQGIKVSLWPAVAFWNAGSIQRLCSPACRHCASWLPRCTYQTRRSSCTGQWNLASLRLSRGFGDTVQFCSTTPSAWKIWRRSGMEAVLFRVWHLCKNPFLPPSLSTRSSASLTPRRLTMSHKIAGCRPTVRWRLTSVGMIYMHMVLAPSLSRPRPVNPSVYTATRSSNCCSSRLAYSH